MGKLIELRVQGYRRVKAVSIRPDGSVVVVSGRNTHGKTSTLHAVWTLLRGRTKDEPVVINDTSEQCVLYGDFQDFKVTRTFRRTEGDEETMSLKIEQADGTRITTKQQGFIDALLPRGDLAFDPLEFSRATDKDRYEILKGCVPGYDFDAMARDRKDAFDKRTEANRLKERELAAASVITLPAGEKPRPIDVAGKLDALSSAARTNAEIDRATADRDRERSRIEAAREQVRKLRADADRLEQAATDDEEKMDSLPALGKPVDVTALRQEIDKAEVVKVAIALFEKRQHHEDAAERYEAEAEALTATINDLDKRKAEAIAAAKLPVEGLTLGDGTVLLNGLPFSQASGRERIMTAVAIQMRLNPKIRVMTIDEASGIDEEGLEVLEELAEAHDFTVLIARVADDRGYVIEDGSVAQRGAE